MKAGLAKFTVAMLNSLLVAGLSFLPITWIIRDGMGPGSIESNGYEAILKCFKTFYVGPILILLGVLKLILNIFLISNHRVKADRIKNFC